MKKVFGVEMYDYKEVAEQFGVSVRAVQLWVHDGRFDAVHIGKAMYIRKEQIMEYLQGSKKKKG